MAIVHSQSSSFMRLTPLDFEDRLTKSSEVLTAIFSVPHQEFLSSWCSSDLPFPEEDATVEFDSHVASGCVLDSLSSSDLLNVMSSGFTLIPSIMPRASYAHQRVSLLVKIIANLHCFAPKICKEEKDVFLNKFLECLRGELPESSASDFVQLPPDLQWTIVTQLVGSH